MAGKTAPFVDKPADRPQLSIPDKALGFRVQLYGMHDFADLFTNRQLVALGAFADAVAEVLEWVGADGGDPTYGRALTSVLGQFNENPPEGDYRILWIGNPKVMPVPPWTLAPGIGYAITDDGPLTQYETWPGRPSRVC